MKKIKNFKQFVNEGLSEDYALDIYLQLIRIIGIHEKHYHNDNKIVSDKEFKNKIAEYMNKLVEGKNILSFLRDNEEDIVSAEKFCLLLNEYEKKYYDTIKLSKCKSLFDVIMYLVEDTIETEDALTVNNYITGFSEKDIEEYEEDENDDDIDEEFNKDEPSRYKHNKTDKYLGRYDRWDLYISNDNNTLIARYGNEEDNYTSGKRNDKNFQHSKYTPKELKEAERRATNLNYIEPYVEDEEEWYDEPGAKIDNSEEKLKLLKGILGENKIVMCINNKERNGYEHTCITIGNTYIVVREFNDKGIEKYEIEEDDDLLPDKKFPKSWFIDYDEEEPEE